MICRCKDITAESLQGLDEETLVDAIEDVQIEAEYTRIRFQAGERYDASTGKEYDEERLANELLLLEHRKMVRDRERSSRALDRLLEEANQRGLIAS